MADVDYFSRSAPGATNNVFAGRDGLLSDPSRGRHRHTAALHAALSSLTEFAQEARDVGSGITHELCTQLGWNYLGTQAGVRIFSLDSDDEHAGLDDVGTHHRHHLLNEDEAASPSNRSRPGAPTLRKSGVRVGEKMPYFRGEAWLPGEWRMEDLAATMASLDARKGWDSTFDSINSRVVARLSPDGDLLMRLMMIGQFPVASRDNCLAQGCWFDADEQTFAVVGTSVEDALVPAIGPRPDIRFTGFFVRAMDRPPEFEELAEADSSMQSPLSPTATRPSHRRARSNMSIPVMKRMPSQQSLQTSSRPTLARGASTFGMSYDTRGPSSIARAVPMQIPATPALPNQSYASRGCHVSYLVRASPGSNLPQTYVNALSMNLPLSIAAIQRYLQVYGFVPHVSRESLCPGLTVLEEHFDPFGGTYRLVFRTSEDVSRKETKIRFHGLSFRGQFLIDVARASEWRLSYDVPPASPTTEEREEEHSHDHRRRRSSLSVSGGHAHHGRSKVDASSPVVTSPASTTSTLLSSIEPALLPGPQGGCTLTISNAGITAQPVSVTITKKVSAKGGNDSTALPLLHRDRGQLLRNSEALGRASREAFERPVAEDLDSFLYSLTDEGRAAIGLENAKRVLRELQANDADQAATRKRPQQRQGSVDSGTGGSSAVASSGGLQLQLGNPKKANERRRQSLQGIEERDDHEHEHEYEADQ